MRALLFALLLLNVAFFAWAHWVDVPAAPASAAALPALHLAQNTNTNSNPDTPAHGAEAATGSGAGAAATVPAAAAPTRCRSIGPFADVASANAAATTLGSRGLAARQRMVATQAPDGYWVYVPDLKDPTARRSAMARLNSAGLRDVASMPQPDEADRLSVGIFSDQRGAVRRAEQVRALGFAPVLEARQRAAAEQWLDLALKSGDADPPIEELTAAAKSVPAGQGASAGALKITDCPAKSSGG